MLFVFGVYVMPLLIDESSETLALWGDGLVNAAFTMQAAVFFLYVPLLAYGILRTHLFDIDLRIKRTVKRTTVIAAFVSVFFLVSELAELYFSTALGNTLGIVVTSVLVFFLAPIQRAAESLSDATMPNTQQTPEYEAFRKLQVYESACYSSFRDGTVPPEHRPILDGLVRSLGIDPITAKQVEEDVAENTR